MANEVAKLIFKADTSDIDAAIKRLGYLKGAANDAEREVGKLGDDAKKASKGVDKLGDEAKQSTKQVGNLGKAAGSAKGKILGFAAGIASVATGMAFASKFVEVNKQFAIMNAQLLTATGSASAAAEEFERLKKFAATTPFDLAQSVDGFVKLKNLGLDPSQESMRSFGNTAAAMGKDLNQMIEAVADASTMEFERLKEFGIKAKQQTDTVSFTFQGVTTTVKKNAEEITGYLKDIGDEKFGTAMAGQAASFAGAISNLGDTFDNLFREAGAGGAAETMSESIRSITESLGTSEAIRGAETLANAMANIVAAAGSGVAGLITLIGKLQEFRDEQATKSGTSAKGGFLRFVQGLNPFADDSAQMPEMTPEQSAANESIIDQIVSETTGVGATFQETESPAVENKKAEIDALKQLDLDFQKYLDDKKQSALDVKIQEYELEQSLEQDHKDKMLSIEENFEQAKIGLKEMAYKDGVTLIGKGLKKMLGDSKASAVAGVAIDAAMAGANIMIQGMAGAEGIRASAKLASLGMPPGMRETYISAGETQAAASLASSKALAVKAMAVKFGMGLAGAAIGGGGGGGGGGSTGASAAAQTPVQEAANDEITQAPQAINVTVDGSIDPEGARRIIEAINEATEDGLEINALVGS